jgi:hypothetical protein
MACSWEKERTNKREKKWTSSPWSHRIKNLEEWLLQQIYYSRGSWDLTASLFFEDEGNEKEDHNLEVSNSLAHVPCFCEKN